MKKKISRILGVGLTFVLMASLMVFAAPVSAGELSFSAETIPTTTGSVIAPDGFDIIDLAVGGDGETIWAVGPGSEYFYPEVTTATDATVTANITITYTDTDGSTQTSTITNVPTTVSVGATVEISVRDIENITLTGWTGATVGVVVIKGASSLATFGTYDVTTSPTFTEGVIPKSMFKSTDAGATFAAQGTPSGVNTSIDLIAIAPDDNDIVAIAADTTDAEVYITTNGGTTWGTLGTVEAGTGDVATAIYDLDISPDSSGVHYIAAAGIGTAATTPGVYVFNSGAAAPVWKNACIDATTDWETDWTAGDYAAIDSIRAVKFSPNFASDQLLTAVSEEISATGRARFHVASFNTKKWDDDAGFPSQYPVSLESTANVTAVNKAAIALAPDYLGGDDALRVAFVGASLTVASLEAGGIYRLKDYSLKDIKDAAAVGSIGYDGTNLVAGAWTDAEGNLSNAVYRCDEPLVTTPTFSTTSSLKRPGGKSDVVTDVIVAWAGEDVVAGCAGDESAFAVSKNNGKSFNDISLIETTLTNLTDVAVSADGSKVYLATDDGADFSLWRQASSWERVLAVDGKAGFIVRLAPEDADVIFAVDQGTTSIYYASDADEKWFTRTGRYSVQDLAVESADVAYIGVSGAKTVSKSTNAGFTWATAKSTALAGGNVHSIVSLGEDKLIVGSTLGYVSYSTDGNSSWTKISKVIETDAVLTQVTASGLADDDYIYAASSLGPVVVRWQIGTSTAWKSLAATANTSYSTYGIALEDGVLYTASSDGANSEVIRTLSPTAAAPSADIWSKMYSAGEAFNAAPQALRVTAGSTKLWMVDTVSTHELFSFTDTLADVGPTLSAPAEATEIAMNPVSGLAYAVSLSWERLSKADAYKVQVALDSGFDEKVYTPDAVAATSATVSHVVPAGTLMPDTTYYWRVKVSSTEADTIVYSPFSEVRSIIIGELEPIVLPAPDVTVEAPPAPVAPPPVVVPPPEVTVTVPPYPEPAPAIPPYLLWIIIAIGAILVIAVIVLIVRTRRAV